MPERQESNFLHDYTSALSKNEVSAGYPSAIRKAPQNRGSIEMASFEKFTMAPYSHG
jgi:hypothetical protein